MANEVRIRVVAEDKTKGVFGGVKAGMKGVLTGAAALGGGIALAMVKASDAARESAKITAQTNAVIKSTGGAANISAKGVDKLSTALSNKTGVDDEVIKSGANMLLTFTNIRNEAGKGNDVFNQTLPILNDMSVALGQDMKSSAMQVGKALNDPIKGITALKRVGVTFNEEQIKTITHLAKTGKTAQAQKIILAELRKEFGGSAEAQATWADKAKVAAGNIQESFGDLVNKTFAPIGKWFVEEGAPAVQHFIDKVSKDKDLKRSLKGLGDAIGAITDSDFKGTLNKVADALPGIVDGMSKAANAAGELYDAIKAVNSVLGDRGGIGDEKGALGGITKTLNNLNTTVENKIKDLRHRVVSSVKKMWGEAADSFKKDNGQIISGVKDFTGRVAGSVSRLGGRLKSSTSDMLSSIKSSWKARTGEIADRVAGWKDHLVAIGRRLSSSLRSGMSDMWASIKDRFRSRTSDIADRVSGWKDRLVTTGKKLSSSLRDVMSNMLTKIKDRFRSGVDAIGRAWDDLKGKAKAPVRFVIQTVLNGGLIRAFNTIAGAVGVRKLPAVHVPRGWASGGVLPGFTPGRDVHRFYSPTGGVMDLSGGEAIVRPELARRVGKKNWEAANAAAAHGRLTEAQGYLGGYAQGTGFLGGRRPVPPGWTRRHSGYSWARWAGDLQASMHTPVHAWKAGTIAAVRYLTSSYGRHIIENTGGSRVYYAHLARAIVRGGQHVRQGQTIGYSDSTGNSTGPHLHFEIRGGNAAISGGGGGGGAIASFIDYVKKLRDKFAGPLSRLKGIGNSWWAQAIKAGVIKLKDGMIAKVKDAMKSLVAKVGSGFTALAGGSNRAIGRRMMLQRWPASQWPPLNSLWTKESGWNTHALNRSSGAYGIPQSLPGSKMASAGSDWRNNPATQIKWGLGYIRSRYGSPAAAWRHSQRTNWYDRGGILHSGGIAMNASGLPERVLSPAMTKSFDRLVQVMDRGRGGAGNTYITINAPNYVGSQEELRRTLVDMNHRGQLEVIKSR